MRTRSLDRPGPAVLAGRPALPAALGPAWPLALLALAAAALLGGCGGSGGEPDGGGEDLIAPAKVTDLYVQSTTTTSATLTWTAPGDDAAAGTAAAYSVRYSTTALTPESWGAADTVATPPAPLPAGTRQSVVVSGLAAGQEYWFGLRAVDEAGRWSPLSNVRHAVATVTSGRTWRVKADHTGDAPTLQAAIDSARAGDLVLVAPGTYSWTSEGCVGSFMAYYGMMAFLDMPQVRDFTVRSEAGPAATIIDCQNKGRGIYFQGGTYHTTNITVEGFTVRRGYANALTHYAGGGFFGHLSNTVTRDCVFENCTALGSADGDSAGIGGAIWYGGVSTVLFENCVVRNNQANFGAGIALINSPGASVLRDCVVTGNVARVLGGTGQGGSGGGVYVNGFRLQIEGCVLADNRSDQRGGGLRFINGHDSSVASCTFVRNQSYEGGGVAASGEASLVLERSIVAGGLGGGAFSYAGPVAFSVGCCDVYGNAGGNALPDSVTDAGGNFSLDPRFCGGSGTGTDFRLRDDSPCAPGRHPEGADCGLVGAGTVGCLLR